MTALDSGKRNGAAPPPDAGAAAIFDLVHALGGPGELAGRLGVSAQAICGWYESPRGIPPRHHIALWRLAQARGLPWRPPGAEGLRLVAEP